VTTTVVLRFQHAPAPTDNVATGKIEAAKPSLAQAPSGAEVAVAQPSPASKNETAIPEAMEKIPAKKDQPMAIAETNVADSKIVSREKAEIAPEKARVQSDYIPPPAPAPAASAALSTSRDDHAEARPARKEKKELSGALSKSLAEQPSERQLEIIRTLKRDGKLEAAKKALAELQKQFPEFKVPEDLRALIQPEPTK